MYSATVILALLAEGRTDEARQAVELNDPLYGYVQAVAGKLDLLSRLTGLPSGSPTTERVTPPVHEMGT